MNQAQRAHATNRLTEIFMKKINEITKVTEAQHLTNSERLDLIRNGKVRLKTEAELTDLWVSRRDEIHHVFDFSEYEWEESHTIDKRKEAAIKKKYQETIDKVMLGDSQEALALIKEFEK